MNDCSIVSTPTFLKLPFPKKSCELRYKNLLNQGGKGRIENILTVAYKK